MKTGVVIVAAGLSSRMNRFKPLLPIGDTCVIRHIVSTFRQAGVSPIVLITGHRAEELKAALVGSDVVFLHNKCYQNTEMFDSAKIGLKYVQEHCDRAFFTPADVPLFTAQTVRTLMESDGLVCYPVCGERRGHPILLSAPAISRVLKDSGDDGLRGALRRCGAEAQMIQVADQGILMDIDTPEDYHTLRSMHEAQTD